MIDELLEEDRQKAIELGKSWGISEKRIGRLIEDRNALVQRLVKRLDTEAETYDIYTPLYGVKTLDLLGKEVEYAALTLKRRAIGSLKQEEGVHNVTLQKDERFEKHIKLTFLASTDYGDILLEKSS